MDNTNEEKNVYKKINIMKNYLSESPFIFKELSPNITISNSKIITPKEKIHAKTSSTFIYKINFRNNNQNNCNKLNNYNHIIDIKKSFSNDIEKYIYRKNKNKSYNLKINKIQLDKNSLRLISIRNIKNKRISLVGNKSEFYSSRYINNKKNKQNIVKFRFLQSQKNYYKRISNSREFGDKKNNINNYKFELPDFGKNYSIRKINNYLLKKNKEKIIFPLIYNSLQNSLTKKSSKKYKIININYKNNDIKDNNINKPKSFRSFEHNILSDRLNFNKFKIEEEQSIKKNKDNKPINDKYINDISFVSNKSTENEKINSNNNIIVHKRLSKQMNHKIIHIKKNLFNLDKKLLNNSIQDNKDVKEITNFKESRNKNKSNFFKENNIKSIYRIKRVSIDNSIIPEINKNIIFNSLLREKLFQ